MAWICLVLVYLGGRGCPVWGGSQDSCVEAPETSLGSYLRLPIGGSNDLAKIRFHNFLPTVILTSSK